MTKNLIKNYDICIIGAGLAGSILAYKLSLSNKNLKIIILEKGNDISLTEKEKHKILNEEDYGIFSIFKLQEEKEKVLSVGNANYNINSHRLFTAGGTWEIATGNAVRFDVDDFAMKSKNNIGYDWPISYDELEKYYLEAEILMGVAGDKNLNYKKRWRSSDFPLPAFPFSNIDNVFIESSKKLGINILPMPQARNSLPYNGFNICEGVGTCTPFCPTGAKFSAKNRCLEKAISKENIDIFFNTFVYNIDIEKNGNNIIGFFNEDNNKEVISANICIIASHTIESVRLLLNSRSKNFPNGIGNNFNQVGKYFMEHPQISINGVLKNKIKRGKDPFQTARCDDFAEFNSITQSRFILEFNNHYPLESTWIKNKDTLKNIHNIKDKETFFNRYVRVSGMVEDFPVYENNITIDNRIKDFWNIPVAKLNYDIKENSNKSLKIAEEKIREIFEKSEILFLDKNINFSGHQMGGIRMGNNKEISVVNKNLQIHNLENLFILGSSVFPTGSCSNPSLTISALAIRLSNFILDKFSK